MTAHFIASELEGAVVANLRRKEADAEYMAGQMVAYMADLTAAEIKGVARQHAAYRTKKVAMPKFMEAANG